MKPLINLQDLNQRMFVFRWFFDCANVHLLLKTDVRTAFLAML